MINLYNKDCMKFMADKPDKYYDLAIVDVPYGSKNIQGGYTSGIGGQGSAKQKNYCKSIWKCGCPDKQYFEELFRVSKDQIIWGANHFMSKIPFDSSCWIVWDKKNENTDYADCELAWTSFNSAVRKFEFMWNGMLQGDMKNKQQRIHPTEKPVSLYEWLLDKYAKKGNKIFDSHGGSMSSAIACYNLGYDLDICELDPEYFKQAKERFEQHTRQIRLTDFTEQTK